MIPTDVLTVQQLIEALQAIEDKSALVYCRSESNEGLHCDEYKTVSYASEMKIAYVDPRWNTSAVVNTDVEFNKRTILTMWGATPELFIEKLKTTPSYVMENNKDPNYFKKQAMRWTAEMHLLEAYETRSKVNCIVLI